MTKPPEAFAELEDLLDFGSGMDMRTTLLRVLTHLYLQRPTHTPEDEHYYTELALRLIDAADLPERAALAARLAPYSSPPRAVIERLARDVIEVAAPILKHSPCLSAGDLPSPSVHGASRRFDRGRTSRGVRALGAVLRGGRGRASAHPAQSRLCLAHSTAAARRHPTW